jgi:hypothetical protein
MPPRLDSSRRSPQPQTKADPYANKTHKRIDVLLVLMTVLLIAFAFRTAAQQRTNSAAPNIVDNHAHAAQSQQATSK